MRVKILHNQSILDIAIQHTGSVENAFLIAKENSLAVSDFLVAGYEMMIPNGASFNRDILNYYSSKQIRPATGTINDEIIPELKGIGIMRIEGNFKVG